MKKLLNVSVAEDELAILWLGQNSFFFKTASRKVISIDPYFSRTLSLEDYCHPDPPIQLDSEKSLSELAAVDYVVCTHDHLDHTDPDTLTPFAKASPTMQFVGPPESYDHFLKIGIEADRATKIELGEESTLDGIRLKATYSEPTDKRDDDPSSGTTHLGYVFDFGPFKLYHSGDTKVGLDGYVHKLQDVIEEMPDIVMVSINSGAFNPGPEDAAKLTNLIKPKIVIPMHYDCFTQNTIDPQEFVDVFSKLRSARGPESDTEVVVMDYGGLYIYKHSG